MKWEQCCSGGTRKGAEWVVGRGQRRLNQTDLERQAKIHKKRNISGRRNCTFRHRIESERFVFRGSSKW